MNVKFSLIVMSINWDRINVINSEVYDNAGRKMDFESIEDDAVKLVNMFKGRVRLQNGEGETVVDWNYYEGHPDNVTSAWDKKTLEAFISECENNK